MSDDLFTAEESESSTLPPAKAHVSRRARALSVGAVSVFQANALAWCEEQARQRLPTERFDCIVTDPPYDSLRQWDGIGTTARMGFGRGKDATESDKFYATIDREELWNLMGHFHTLLKPNGYCYIMCDQVYLPILLNWAREEMGGGNGWSYSKPLVWDKVDGGMGYHWRATCEYIVMLQKGKKKLNFLGWQDILRFKRVQGDGHYPTEKPFGLIERIILNSTQPGDLVLDPFSGSGVTAHACMVHGVNCVTMDIAEKSVEWTKRRIEGAALAP